MSDRCSNPSGSLGPDTRAGLWTASYCASCPAHPVCAAVNTDSACGSPAEYPQTSAHPEYLAHTARREDFAFPPFQSGDRTGTIPRGPLLTVSDGTLTPNVKLHDLLAAVRRTSRNDHTGNLAVLHGPDKYLHALLRYRGSLGQRLAEAGFTAAIAPGYSTWDQHTPFEALLAQALTARIATELDANLPTVPTVIWRTHGELTRWTTWVIENNRQAIALHPGPLRTASEWAWWTDGLVVLRELLHRRPMHAFVNGPCTHARFADVIRIWGTDVSFMTQQPWATAIKGKLINPDDFSDDALDPEDRTAAERLSVNITIVRSCIDRLTASTAPLHRMTS